MLIYWLFLKCNNKTVLNIGFLGFETKIFFSQSQFLLLGIFLNGFFSVTEPPFRQGKLLEYSHMLFVDTSEAAISAA